MIDFPVATTAGQEFTSGSSTWIWDGVKWVPKPGTGGSGGTGGLDQATADALYVNVGGDTMTGPLVMSGGASFVTLSGAPTANLHAASKAYVDSKVPAGGAYLPLSGGTLTGHLDATSATFTGSVIAKGPGRDQLAVDTAGTLGAWVVGSRNGVGRWGIGLGDGSPETGGNRGSDFSIVSLNDAGDYLDAPLSISRDEGWVETSSALVSNGGMGVQGDINGYGWASLSLGPLANGDYCQIYREDSQMFEVGILNTRTWTGIALDDGGAFSFSGGGAFKVGGGPWGDSSDARIKTVQGEYTLGLNEVTQLRPVVYTYLGNDTQTAELSLRKGEKAKPEGKPVTSAPYPASSHANAAIAQTPFVGLIAQEVEPVFPGMVSQRAGYIDGVAVADIRALDTNELLYALVNAVKDLAAQNAALTERINILEGGA